MEPSSAVITAAGCEVSPPDTSGESPGNECKSHLSRPAALEKCTLKCVLLGNESCHCVSESRSFKFVLLPKVSRGRSDPWNPADGHQCKVASHSWQLFGISMHKPNSNKLLFLILYLECVNLCCLLLRQLKMFH